MSPGPSPEGGGSWAAARARHRRAERARVMARVAVPIQHRVRDPLKQRRRTPGRAVGWVLGVLGLSLAIHAGLGLVFWRFGLAAAGRNAKLADRAALEIEVVDSPPPEPEPKPDPKPEPETVEPPEPKPKRRVKPQRRPPPKRQREAPTPSADPIDQPDEPSEPESPPPRRIVGLNLKSTVTGGDGPAFATGNTRMGQTKEDAEAPKPRKELPKGEAPQRGQNESATRVPGFASGGNEVVKPKRLERKECPYPKDLKARGLEATVTVQVRVGTDGRVERARVVDGATVGRFDEAALSCARAARYAPATRGGKPVPYTITYAYRFRLEK